GTQIRGSELRAGLRTTPSTRPRAETTHDWLPRRSRSTCRSAWTVIRSVCGNARSKSTETTFEAAAIRASSSPAFTSRRLRPTSPPSARSTSARASGEPPTTTTRRTAKTDVSRAAAYAPAATTASRTPTSTDLNDGRSLRSEGTPLRTGKATARELALLRSPTGPDSPRRPDPLQGRQLERAEEAHLVLELDAEAARDAGAGFGHQRDRVGRRRLAGVLDEVGVSVRDPRPADLEALET